jgi:hypothetical protein
MDAITSPRQIKERPIIFSATKVRAILEGRKTQTRRLLKPQPISVEECRRHTGSDYGIFDRGEYGGTPGVFCVSGPVGVVIDRSGFEIFTVGYVLTASPANGFGCGRRGITISGYRLPRVS